MFEKVAHDNERYFRRLVGNITRCRRLTGDDNIAMFVRAGNTGNGTSPNYQVENAQGGVIACYSGLNHKEMDPEAFNPDNVTRPYSYAEILQFLDERRKKR